MNKQFVISATEKFVNEKALINEAAHDWLHIFRVREMALRIGAEVHADMFIVEMGALLHDIADSKLIQDDYNTIINSIKLFLMELRVLEDDISRILDIIENVSFRKRDSIACEKTKEFQVVSDADMLDALGAIGIARAFTYGGSKGRLLYDPEKTGLSFHDSVSGKQNNSDTISHFYDKLLLLKDILYTDFARQIAEKRHQFMLDFLRQFKLECSESQYYAEKE